VPTTRRESILKLAHDSVYGGHLGERKTCQRIKLSFYWPGLKRSVREYVMSCQDCQLRARKLATDRVPITPISKNPIPFQTLNIDCIGPWSLRQLKVTNIVCALSIAAHVGRLCIH